MPTLKISSKADEEDVAEIFVRVNSGRQKLTEKNFIETLLAVYDNDVHDKITAFCAESRIPAQGTSFNQIVDVRDVTTADEFVNYLNINIRRENGNTGDEKMQSKGTAYPPGHTEQLTAHQRYMLNYQLCFPQCMLNNIPALIRFPKRSAEPEKLRTACEQVFRMHPSYALVHSGDETGGIVLKYRPDMIGEVPVIEVDEEAFLRTPSALVRPFPLMDSPLYRCEIYAGEENTYLFLDLYHTLSDGNSLMITLRDIFAVMSGETCRQDGYIEYLSECSRRRRTADWEKAEAAFRALYGGKNFASVPRFDRRRETDQRCARVRQFGMTQGEWEAAAKGRGITPNQSLVAACLAALSAYNREENVMVNWTFHGRDSEEKQDMTGLLIGNLPVGATIRLDTTIRELLDEVHEKCEQGKPYGWLSPGVQDNRPGENDRIAVLYQNFLSLPPNAPDGTDVSYLFDALTGQVNCFNILADKRKEAAEQVELLFVCNLRYYEPDSLERYSEIFCRTLQRLLLAEENSGVLVIDS